MVRVYSSQIAIFSVLFLCAALCKRLMTSWPQSLIYINHIESNTIPLARSRSVSVSIGSASKAQCVSLVTHKQIACNRRKQHCRRGFIRMIFSSSHFAGGFQNISSYRLNNGFGCDNFFFHFCSLQIPVRA